MVTKEQLQNFIKQCLILNSLDFPEVAYSQQLSWNKDIKPQLKDEWFKEEMEEMLERVKFKLIKKLHEAAINGALPGRPTPNSAHIKEMMKLINSGVLLGDEGEGEALDEGFSPEEEERHLTRLGIKDVKSRKSKDN